MILRSPQLLFQRKYRLFEDYHPEKRFFMHTKFCFIFQGFTMVNMYLDLKKNNKNFRLKKITVSSDWEENFCFFLGKFSLQKDYSSKWVGEKFSSFFDKKSKIRSHGVKKRHFFVKKNVNFMKISNFFSDSKNGFGPFLNKNPFHQW